MGDRTRGLATGRFARVVWVDEQELQSRAGDCQRIALRHPCVEGLHDLRPEGKAGWANAISTRQDYGQITDGLGRRSKAALNTYKPFASGVVMHPAIDDVIQLRDENRFSANQVAQVILRVNPRILGTTGKKAPQTGLESKFSIYHAIAVALFEGNAGEQRFSDRAARDAAVIELRNKVARSAGIDPSLVD